MNTLRDHYALGISYWQWLTGIGIGVAVVAGLWALRELIVQRLKNADRTDTWVDDLLLLLAQRTSRVYMVAMGIAAMGYYESTGEAMPSWLRIFAVAAFCLQLLRWANASVDFWLEHWSRSTNGHHSGRASLAVVGVLIRAAVFLVVMVLALDNFGINVTALVTGLGITGIAVALAVQNILGDLLAALAITFDKPFAVGDEIVVGDVTGRVENVGLKTTRLRLGSGEEVSIANAEVMRTRLTNNSRTRVRMLPLTVGVPANGQSGASLTALAAKCEEAARSVAGVQTAKAKLNAIVDGRARIVVESVLQTPQDLAVARPALIAALTDAAVASGHTLLGIG
jgi:small-conductance mechanosensitive channel